MDDDDEVEVEVISVEAEMVELVPSVRELSPVQRAEPAALPVIQAAAVAATGFVAGAVTVVLLRRHGLTRRARERHPLGDLADAGELSRLGLGGSPPGTTRTYLVNVRVISRP
jgi:2-methylaconitate cis-trans-isomerase PrpF